jgi:outer membrane phospholipase A
MKKLFIIILLSFISIGLYAKEKEEVMTAYKDNYFLFGDMTHQTKWQLSAKFNLIYPSDIGLYGGYTQLTKWMVYGNRDKMDSMYMPELLWKFESGKNVFNDFVIPYIDFLQFSPIQHCSTGVETADHRSMDIYYGQIQASIGEVYNFGFNAKVFGYYDKNENNKDINKYKKNYEADVFFKLKSKTVEYLDKEEFHCKFTGNPLGNGSFTLEGKFRILTARVQPKIFIQYCRGYNEFFIDYNKKDQVVRAGLVFDGQ